MTRTCRLALTAVLALLMPASTALADPALDGTFPVSGMPDRLALGPDGNVWFTMMGSSDSKEFGRITPDGTIAENDSPSAITLRGITAGPDGNLWATGINNVVRIDPADPGNATAFSDNQIGSPNDITVGPDGHLWTGSGGNLVEVTPSTPTPTFDDHTPNGLFEARGIASAGGFIWVADRGDGSVTHPSQIVKVDLDGQAVKATPTGGGGSFAVGAGPDGQLAFTDPLTPPQLIGRIDYDGNLVGNANQFPAGTDPSGIAFGNDGAYWIPEFAQNKLGRVTPVGDHTQPISFDAGSGPRNISKGSGDTLWVGLEQSARIARITGVTAPPPTPPPTDPPPTNPPPTDPFVFDGVTLTGKSFTVRGKSVTFPATCPAGFTGDCTGTIALRTAAKLRAPKDASAADRKAKKRRLKLGSKSFSIPAGTTANVKVKLNGTARKLLAKRRKLKAVAAMTATADGTEKTSSATVTIKAAKKKRR
jgi:virginiamycin B lyase